MAISVEHLIKPLVHFWEISNEPWGAKDHTSKFIYTNRKYHDLLALLKAYNVEGRFDGELPAATADFQTYFQLHDRKVEQFLDRLTSIEIHPFENQPYLQPWYFDKYPLIDETGTCRGTIFHGRPVDTIELKKIKTQTSLIFTPPSDFFSKREWEVLFYLLQGLTIKEISIQLFVSHRTVSNHVHRFYQKASVKFKNELIDYCFQNNISNYVPENLFRTASSNAMGLTT